jgi:hypothetical protein
VAVFAAPFVAILKVLQYCFEISGARKRMLGCCLEGDPTKPERTDELMYASFFVE